MIQFMMGSLETLPIAKNATERPSDNTTERLRAWSEAFESSLANVAQALRDNGVAYSVFSSIAFDRQVERELPLLERNAAEGDDTAAALTERARTLLAHAPDDIDGVVLSKEELRRLPAIFGELPGFRSVGFRGLPGEENAQVYSGEFRFPDPEAKDDPTKDIVIPLEFFFEQKINTPGMIARAEPVDRKSGLRVHDLRDLKEQYGNVLAYETMVKDVVDKEEEKLRTFVGALHDPNIEDPEALLRDFAAENGMVDVALARRYIEEFERIERDCADAKTPERRLICQSALVQHLENLKIKIPQRVEKLAFLDDLYKYLDHGSAAVEHPHVDQRLAA